MNPDPGPQRDICIPEILYLPNLKVGKFNQKQTIRRYSAVRTTTRQKIGKENDVFKNQQWYKLNNGMYFGTVDNLLTKFALKAFL